MGAETTVSRLIFFRSIGYSGVGRTQAKRKPQAGNAAILGAIVGLPLWLSWEVLMNLMVSNSSEGLHHKTIQSSRYQKKFSHVNISGIMTGALPNQFWPILYQIRLSIYSSFGGGIFGKATLFFPMCFARTPRNLCVLRFMGSGSFAATLFEFNSWLWKSHEIDPTWYYNHL